jgi:hypothetical protein
MPTCIGKGIFRPFHQHASWRTDIPVSSASCLGVKFGRPQKLNKEQQTLAMRLLKEGKSVNEVAKTLSSPFKVTQYSGRALRYPLQAFQG